jgi:hypothetical protein
MASKIGVQSLPQARKVCRHPRARLGVGAERHAVSYALRRVGSLSQQHARLAEYPATSPWVEVTPPQKPYEENVMNATSGQLAVVTGASTGIGPLLANAGRGLGKAFLDQGRGILGQVKGVQKPCVVRAVR